MGWQDACGVADCDDVVRERLGDHGTRADGGSGAYVRHDDGSRADPAIRPDRNGRESALAGACDPATGVAGVLVFSAEDLHARSDLCPRADGGPAEDTIRAVSYTHLTLPTIYSV